MAGRLFVALVAISAVGGSLLSYRWPTPWGNVSISRALLPFMVVAALMLVRDRGGALSRRVIGVPLAAAAVVCLTVFSLLRTDNFEAARVSLGTTTEAMVLVAATAVGLGLLGVAHRTQGLAMVAIAYLPSGFIGLWQAGQRLQGKAATIPLMEHFPTVIRDLPGARTSFHTAVADNGYGRIAAATGDPPTFGILSALVVLLAVDLLLRQRDEQFLASGWLWALGATAVVALCGTVLSASITAVGVLGVGGPLVVSSHIRRNGISTELIKAVAGSSLLAIGVLGVLAITPLWGFVALALDRLFAIATGGGSAPEHWELATSALEVGVSNPVFGVGLGDLSSVIQGQEVSFSSVHNAFAEAFAEGGVVLLLPVIVLFVILGRQVPTWATVTTILAFAVYLDLGRLPWIWALLGALVAASSDPRSKTSSPQTGRRRESVPPKSGVQPNVRT